MSSAKDLIAQLKSATVDTVSVFIPSLGSYHEFKPITVKQQKELIKQSLNGLVGTLKLTTLFNKIIKENNVEGFDVPISDRNAILAQLRVHSLGRVAYDSKGEKQTLASNFLLPFNDDLIEEIEDSGIKVTIIIPSLEVDNAYFNNIIKSIEQNINGIKPDDIVIKTYIAEISKFINTIEFNGVVYDNSGVLPDEVVELLPTTLINKITDSVKKIKEFDNSFITFENGDIAVLNARFFCDTV